jgi:uroporphyrinogen-III decarboxylase
MRKEAIKYEIDKKLPYLKEEGGYIPGLDHVIPPDVSLENFTFYANYLKKYLDY